MENNFLGRFYGFLRHLARLSRIIRVNITRPKNKNRRNDLDNNSNTTRQSTRFIFKSNRRSIRQHHTKRRFLRQRASSTNRINLPNKRLMMNMTIRHPNKYSLLRNSGPRHRIHRILRLRNKGLRTRRKDRLNLKSMTTRKPIKRRRPNRQNHDRSLSTRMNMRLPNIMRHLIHISMRPHRNKAILLKNRHRLGSTKHVLTKSNTLHNPSLFRRPMRHEHPKNYKNSNMTRVRIHPNLGNLSLTKRRAMRHTTHHRTRHRRTRSRRRNNATPLIIFKDDRKGASFVSDEHSQARQANPT